MEQSKCYSYLQEEQGGGTGKLQVSQAHLAPWEDDKAANPGNHFYTHEGPEGDWEQS